MADALDALDQIGGLVSRFEKKVANNRSNTISGQAIQPIAGAIARIYFDSVRPELDVAKSRAGLVDEIDWVIQAILQLATASREKQAYLGQINELRPYLLEATFDLMKSRGTRLVLSLLEGSILETLTALLPVTAASYEQALRDIAQGSRVSWRGTALELREGLRDVIDHLAPDEKVVGSPGFQLEPGQSGPTQKQKVRYVLRARRTSTAARELAEASLERVDEAVAALARSAYRSGSASTHVGASIKDIRNLKRYVDALLGELLEVG
jgi:hypothetical protein